MTPVEGKPDAGRDRSNCLVIPEEGRCRVVRSRFSVYGGMRLDNFATGSEEEPGAALEIGSR